MVEFWMNRHTERQFNFIRVAKATGVLRAAMINKGIIIIIRERCKLP